MRNEMDTDTVSYTAQLSMVFTERYFQGDDGLTTLKGESILERLADELPDQLEVELEFDTEEGELAGLSCDISIDDIAFEEMFKLSRGLELDSGSKFKILTTIYHTIYDALAFYSTPDGLAEVHAEKVADMASHDDLRGDAIHEERMMEGGGCIG